MSKFSYGINTPFTFPLPDPVPVPDTDPVKLFPLECLLLTILVLLFERETVGDDVLDCIIIFALTH